MRPNRPVSPAASAIHHLIDADLKVAPALRDVIHKFAGADAYVAHNCAFEKSFLERHLGQAVWACTYKCALRVWPELASYSCQALRYQLGLINPLGIERDFRDLQDRQVSRLLALKNAASVNANLTEGVRKVRPVRHETTGEDKLAVRVYGWHRVAVRQLHHQIMFGQKEIFTAYYKCAYPLADKGREG